MANMSLRLGYKLQEQLDFVASVEGVTPAGDIVRLATLEDFRRRREAAGILAEFLLRKNALPPDTWIPSYQQNLSNTIAQLEAA